MAKLDIEGGFRNIPIHPSDCHVLGIVWDGKFYFENSLPLGMMSIVWEFEHSIAVEYAQQV